MSLHMWRLEDNFMELVLSFSTFMCVLKVEFRLWKASLVQQVLHLLSFLTATFTFRDRVSGCVWGSQIWLGWPANKLRDLSVSTSLVQSL